VPSSSCAPDDTRHLSDLLEFPAYPASNAIAQFLAPIKPRNLDPEADAFRTTLARQSAIILKLHLLVQRNVRKDNLDRIRGEEQTWNARGVNLRTK
jgi:hypothetical protein